MDGGAAAGLAAGVAAAGASDFEALAPSVEPLDLLPASAAVSPPLASLPFASAFFESAGFEVVHLRQSKIGPGRAHGRKTVFQRLAMAAIDLVNVPLTNLAGICGDRVVMVGQKR